MDTKPTQEQLAKWREKFELPYHKMDLSLTERQRNGQHPTVEYFELTLEEIWQGYLRAMTEQSAEIERLKGEIIKAELDKQWDNTVKETNESFNRSFARKKSSGAAK